MPLSGWLEVASPAFEMASTAFEIAWTPLEIARKMGVFKPKDGS